LILKKGLIYIALLFSLNLYGQNYLQVDTILIKEVEIRGQTIGQDHPGFKIMHLDSSVIRNYSQNTLADLISENSAIYIKSYGSGGLATASFRGTGAGHTQIAWNGINLNNPMIGQFDMSLVPAGFIDDINIFYGGGSMYISNGGFGGVIDLETKPEWDELNQIYLNPGIGSFGRYAGLIKLKAGKSGFQSVTKAFLSNAENDFNYLNTVSGMTPYEETRENNQVSHKGFIQELYYKNSERSYSARLWYQSASRNLPVPIITSSMTPPENQEDESLRTMVTYESSGENSAISITGAFISDKLEYNNEAASVNSRNNSKRILLKSDFETRINGMMKIGFAFNNEVSIVNTNNYAEEKIRNVASFDATAQADLNSWLVARLLIREILQDRTLLSPDFSAGAEIKPFRGKYYLIKTSFSKNSKIPTLNDMFWSPGGNPDLKNENGYTSEIIMEFTNILSNSFRIRNASF
jgi:iron complex outermembrane receptor protein